MTDDRPFLGIILMLGFCALAPLGDSLAKLLGDVMPLLVLLIARFAVQLIVLLPICLIKGMSLRVPKGRGYLLWLRAALHIIGIGAMFTSLQYLPLADAIAIAFVMPFIMLILGHFVLGETVGLQRILACTVGFVGTLLIIQPNFVEVGPPALIPLLVAVVFALFMLVTRKIAKDIMPIPLQTINGLQALVLLSLVAMFVFEPIGLNEIPSSAIWLTVVMGLIGTLAHLLMTWSLRFAPSATLAPMQYLEIPVSTLLGLLIFDDLPNGLAAVGICITVAAGLYIIIRERRLALRPQVA